MAEIRPPSLFNICNSIKVVEGMGITHYVAPPFCRIAFSKLLKHAPVGLPLPIGYKFPHVAKADAEFGLSSFDIVDVKGDHPACSQRTKFKIKTL